MYDESASHRYAITKMMRSILVLHFEDAFQSMIVVEESASRIQRVATNTSAAIDTLLKVSGTVAASTSTAFQPGDQIHLDFDRVWSLRPNANDVQIVNSTSLLGLVYFFILWSIRPKSSLHHRLFRDPVMIADENIRAK